MCNESYEALFATVWHLRCYIAAFHAKKWKVVYVKECQTEKQEEKARTSSPLAHQPLSRSVRQSCLCIETTGKHKLILCGSNCFALLLIAAKWKRLYNPGLRAKVFAGTSSLTFQGWFRSRTSRPPIQQTDNNTVWTPQPRTSQRNVSSSSLWRAVERWNWVHQSFSWLIPLWVYFINRITFKTFGKVRQQLLKCLSRLRLYLQSTKTNVLD